MNLTDFYFLLVVTIIYGIYKTCRINWDHVGLILIKRDFKKSHVESVVEIHVKINKEIESILTLDKIRDMGKIDLHIEVLKLLSVKSDISDLYIKGFDEIESHINRLKHHGYPTGSIFNYLMALLKSIILDSDDTLKEKKSLLIQIIERAEVVMFFIKYIPDNFNEDELNIIDLSKITEEQLSMFNLIIQIYYNADIHFAKKLNLYEEYIAEYNVKF